MSHGHPPNRTPGAPPLRQKSRTAARCPHRRRRTAGQKGIQVTGRALKRIRIAMAKENVTPEQGGLRVGITGGGCSGLSYNIRFDTQPRERDRVYLMNLAVSRSPAMGTAPR
jgi:hypothetical protein